MHAHQQSTLVAAKGKDADQNINQCNVQWPAMMSHVDSLSNGHPETVHKLNQKLPAAINIEHIMWKAS